MTLKAVLFDFNGVIINDESIHKDLIEEILLGENLRPDAKEHDELCLGRSDRACLAAILEKRGRVVTEDYLDGLLTKKVQKYQELMEAEDKLPVYQGVDVFIRELWGAGLVLGLVTGARRENVEYILNRIKIREAFAVVLTSDDISKSKPDPEGYLMAVEHLNQQYSDLDLKPEQCLVIEDTPSGIQAAKRAQMEVVGVANTYPFHMLQRQANWTVDYLQELELERVKEALANVKIRG
ncbi:HAD-superfamily hydrolase, subfamily IA, variant 3 [Halothece sp. PCC 7418]|uniref:HAD family hydrolase n=1 Tax=Halothece sp. (strain PCC 7418) TaxID=65093 RepID=UPI0002A068A7|nr:HAD family phosphatase [Halothece sp. PCC 7418]AFZ43468.1 HAD-superfamily hydrolase, subfamily IA, variant 3 [Halothece sp. PCC 7418]